MSFNLSRDPRQSARARRNANLMAVQFESSIAADGGLSITDDLLSLDLKDTDPGLEIVTGATGGLAIKLDTNPGLDLVSGLAVKLDTTPALALGAGGLGVDLDATEPGLQKTSGLKVLLPASSGLELASGLKVNLDTNPGLSLGAGGLSVDLATNGGLEESTGLKVRGVPVVSSDPSGQDGDVWYNQTDETFRRKQSGVAIAVPGVLGAQGGINDTTSNSTANQLGAAMPTQPDLLNSVDRILRFTMRGQIQAGASGRTYRWYVNFQNGGTFNAADVLWDSNLVSISTTSMRFVITGDIRVGVAGSSGKITGGVRYLYFKTDVEQTTSDGVYDWAALGKGITMFGQWSTGSNNAMRIDSAIFEILN